MGCGNVVLGFLLVTRGGSLLKHALGVLLLAWRRMLLVGAAALVGGLLVGETAAVVASGRIPPPLLSQVVIAIFAVVIAYAASMTVFLEELLHGIIATIRLVEGDVTAGARAAAVIAEREAGEVGSGLMRLFGAKPKPATVAVAAAAVGSLGALASWRVGAPSETDEAIEATDTFVTTAPRPRVDARPVRADQLPRIGWAADAAEATTDPSGGASGQDVAMPPLPAARNSSVQSSPLPPLPVRTPDQPLAQPESWSLPDEPMGLAAPATRPLPVEAETEPTAAPVREQPADEQDLGDFGAPGRPTRPLSRPLGGVFGGQGVTGGIRSSGEAPQAAEGDTPGDEAANGEDVSAS